MSAHAGYVAATPSAAIKVAARACQAVQRSVLIDCNVILSVCYRAFGPGYSCGRRETL
jgi:hypothetical protein